MQSNWEWRKGQGWLIDNTSNFHAYDVNNNAACRPSFGLLKSSEPYLFGISPHCPACYLVVKENPYGRLKKKPQPTFTSDDAWRQLDDLLEKFTKKKKVRRDIEVVARAAHRGVEVILGPDDDIHAKRSTGKRNVDTMRELAQAINDACDFVEESNPVWSGTGGPSRRHFPDLPPWSQE